MFEKSAMNYIYPNNEKRLKLVNINKDFIVMLMFTIFLIKPQPGKVKTHRENETDKQTLRRLKSSKIF